jgi:hypothetical protein
MLAVGFVPDRDDVGPLAGGADASQQLGLGLAGEAVAHPKRVFSNRQEFIHYKRMSQRSKSAAAKHSFFCAFRSENVASPQSSYLRRAGFSRSFPRSYCGRRDSRKRIEKSFVMRHNGGRLTIG